MKKLTKEILNSNPNSISCALIISAGNGEWLDEVRLLSSKKTVLTEAHPYQLKKLSSKIRNQSGEKVLRIGVTGEKASSAILHIYNDLKFNSIDEPLNLHTQQKNIKQVDEAKVPAMSLFDIINKLDIDREDNNLLILNSLGQSSTLLTATPHYYIKKFSWIVVNDLVDTNRLDPAALRNHLECAGFEPIATGDAIYPFHEALYRRCKEAKSAEIIHRPRLKNLEILTDQIVSNLVPSKYTVRKTAVDKVLPQKAFDSFVESQRTGLTTLIASACLTNISAENFGASEYLIEKLEQKNNPPSELASLLRDKLAHSKEQLKRKVIPEISVIIPYHNREMIIAECIQSVLDQTIKNIEILVIDDGSTDGSRATVHAISDDRLVRIDCNVASGNSGTPRNIALRQARGEYIAFVDSDDTIDERYLEELLGQAKRSDADITLSKSFTKLYRDKDGNNKTSKINYIYNPNFIADNNKQFFFVNSFVIWDKLYKRSFLEKHDIKLSESKIGADTLMVAKVYYYANTVSICNNKAAYNYNAFSEGSVTQTYRSRGDIREEDRPYAETFDWMIKEDVCTAYILIQWIRRLMSLSYCLSSSAHDLSDDSMAYLQLTLKEAPFKSALTHLKRKKLNEQYQSIQKLMGMLGRKVIHA